MPVRPHGESMMHHVRECNALFELAMLTKAEIARQCFKASCFPFLTFVEDSSELIALVLVIELVSFLPLLLGKVRVIFAVSSLR